MVVVHDSDFEEYSVVILISNEVSTFFSQWILDYSSSYHIYHRKEMFDSLDSSKGDVHLPCRSSYVIKGIKIVSL